MRRCESADEQGDPRVLHLGKWDDLLVTRMQGDGGNGGKAMARPDEEGEAELVGVESVTWSENARFPQRETTETTLQPPLYIRKIPRLREPRIASLDWIRLPSCHHWRPREATQNGIACTKSSSLPVEKVEQRSKDSGSLVSCTQIRLAMIRIDGDGDGSRKAQPVAVGGGELACPNFKYCGACVATATTCNWTRWPSRQLLWQI